MRRSGVRVPSSPFTYPPPSAGLWAPAGVGLRGPSQDRGPRVRPDHRARRPLHGTGEGVKGPKRRKTHGSGPKPQSSIRNPQCHGCHAPPAVTSSLPWYTQWAYRELRSSRHFQGLQRGGEFGRRITPSRRTAARASLRRRVAILRAPRASRSLTGSSPPG